MLGFCFQLFIILIFKFYFGKEKFAIKYGVKFSYSMRKKLKMLKMFLFILSSLAIIRYIHV